MGARQPQTEWRQGRVLSAESAAALSLAGSDDAIVVVISHDCDIAASDEHEPNCEIIEGKVVDEARGDFTNAKSPRMLHLPFTAGTVPYIGEFVASAKRHIPKELLFKHSPAEKARLSIAELSVLQRWLSVRYARPSFPEEFDRRLKQKKGNYPFDKGVA